MLQEIRDVLMIAGAAYVGVSCANVLLSEIDTESEIKKINGDVPLWYNLKSSTISVDRDYVERKAMLSNLFPYTLQVLGSVVGLIILDSVEFISYANV